MGRQVRKVPVDWEHPKYEQNDVWMTPHLAGRHKPLKEGYVEDAREFMKIANEQGLQEAVDWMGCPDRNDYMPDWPDEVRTHLMMYEDTSEGTPISPAFPTPEALARWLTDNNASAFGDMTANYESWLAVARGGWAPSMVIDSGVMKKWRRRSRRFLTHQETLMPENVGKWTSGPWSVTKDGLHVCGPVDENREKPNVARYCKRDAHLIAAAPELYEACAVFVRKVEAGEAKSTKSYAQMKAAMRKARGES